MNELLKKKGKKEKNTVVFVLCSTICFCLLTSVELSSHGLPDQRPAYLIREESFAELNRQSRKVYV